MIDKTKNIDFGKVALLMGGTSAERDISLLSGEAIYQGLLENNIDVIKIDPKEDFIQKIQNNAIDRAFIALHGTCGEDGTIQGFLTMMGIPFTGSDITGSAISMNKIMSKRIWKQAGFNTADFLQILSNEQFALSDADKIIETLGSVLFVKPANEGSSVGMSKSTNAEELVAAVTKAQEFGMVLIEQFVDGLEYTVGIVNGKTLPSISMITPNEYYDYDAKYLADTTEYFCPSGLSEQEEQQLRSTALAAFEMLGCSGWGRVDFIRDRSSNVFKLLEANTIPGMTKTSLLPKAAWANGISFSELVVSILSTSLAVGEECYG